MARIVCSAETWAELRMIWEFTPEYSYAQALQHLADSLGKKSKVVLPSLDALKKKAIRESWQKKQADEDELSPTLSPVVPDLVPDSVQPSITYVQPDRTSEPINVAETLLKRLDAAHEQDRGLIRNVGRATLNSAYQALQLDPEGFGTVAKAFGAVAAQMMALQKFEVERFKMGVNVDAGTPYDAEAARVAKGALHEQRQREKAQFKGRTFDDADLKNVVADEVSDDFNADDFSDDAVAPENA